MAQPVNINPNQWVSNYADELYGYAMAKTSKTELAEDLVQDTFISALKALANFKGNSSERTWLFSILKNKIADHYRKASTRYEVREENTEDNKSFLGNFFDSDGEWSKKAKPGNWGNPTEESLNSKEFRKALTECVDKLPATPQKVVELKFMDDRESEDICKELNISASNYWVIMHRAKLLLRACLEKNWFNA